MVERAIRFGIMGGVPLKVLFRVGNGVNHKLDEYREHTQSLVQWKGNCSMLGLEESGDMIGE